MPRISQAVGRGAPNQQHDVAVIQVALANISTSSGFGGSGFGGPALWPRPIDGRSSPDLEQAIAAFQTKERQPVTHRIETTGPSLDAMERALPREMHGLTAIEGSDVVILNGSPPHALQDAIRVLRERPLLPRDAAEVLARLAEAVHRTSGLLLKPDGHGITSAGALVQCLAFADVRWLGRDGKPAFSPPTDRVDAAVRTVQRQSLGGGLEWVHGPASSAVSGALAPPTQAQRVGRDMPAPQGGTMRLAVRTRQCLKCLAGQKSGIDRARLARLNLSSTNDPVVDRLLDAAATEIEAGSGAGGGTGGSTNPSGASGAGTSEAEMILGLLTGTNDQAANNLRQAQRQPAAQAQTNAGHGGEGPDIFPSGKNPFQESAKQLLQTMNRNLYSAEAHKLKSLNWVFIKRYESYPLFIDLVGNRKPWDIKRAFVEWSADTLDNREYNRDIWGNIHYCYIGLAVGFYEWELFMGGGVAQYSAHVNN